jgi:multidrug efflux pump subunit AcrB
MKLGLSGALTRSTIRSPLTPLFLLAAIALGLLALITIPREEEPQISVPMVDIHVRADGLNASDAAQLVTKPLEAIVKGIDGVEHVYSQTVDDHVIVTARFVVGTESDNAIVRVHEKVRANLDRIPLGIPEPLIVGRGINDVAIVVVTLSPKPGSEARWDDNGLWKVANELRAELIKVPMVGLTYITGGRPDAIRVEPDPEKLALLGITLQQLVAKIEGANRSFMAGSLTEGGKTSTVQGGQTMTGIPDIGLLLLTARDGRPVYVRDVARVTGEPDLAEFRTWRMSKSEDGTWSKAPAVSLALAKRPGANAVKIAEAITGRLDQIKGRVVPASLDMAVTRNYGETANEKANELLFHLGLATISIVVLIAFSIGWRESIVVLIVIPATILLTMFASNQMGYTINRVSLFALIFSIGILVDDAIVVIENISRHWAMHDGRSRVQAAIDAVAEVGNPTIVATLTVVAALLPMLFVSGLMGPYMAPIPVNASAAMLFSFVVAVVIAPWLLLKIAGRAPAAHHDTGSGGLLGRIYRGVARPIIRTRTRSLLFLLLVGAATAASMVLFYSKDVVVKLLPFDNKSEFQIVADLPEGASLEATERVLMDAAAKLTALPELSSMEINAGTAAPFNFNGLVRHYYLRRSPELGDIQVELLPKAERERNSHDIALEARTLLQTIEAPEGTSIKVVEVPPGPPVLSTLVAEIYGPDAETRRAVAGEVEKIFQQVPFIVDVDNSYGTQRPRLRISIDQDSLEYFGVEQRDVYDTLAALLKGVPVGYSHRGEARYPVEISVRLPASDRSWSERLASTPVPANALPGNRTVVELGDVVRVAEEKSSHAIFRRDGYEADMVTAEMAGSFEAPIYGMLAVNNLVDKHDWGNLPRPEIRIAGQPEDESKPSLLWDGEWEITYVTFRDMGAAFMVAILGIYFLVVAQFGNFKLPLVILLPVPLTLIGIMLGHWLFGAAFTATSMIGFIALAGIIVRNSILLVDFIEHRRSAEVPLRQVLLEAGAIRFKPILLTAIAAMIGAATILLDPIFQGLAISLLFGLLSSTLLTVLVIPAVYILLRDDGRHLGQPLARAGQDVTSLVLETTS